jgi:hypothetical protein
MSVTYQPVHERADRKALKDIATGSAFETFTGVGAVALAILGLAGVVPLGFAAIGTIVIGAGLLFAGAGVAVRYAEVAPEIGREPGHTAELSGGMTAEFVAGVAGIALGILALLAVAPYILTASAMIVFGAGLLLGAGVMSRVNAVPAEDDPTGQPRRRLAREAVSAAAGAQALVGIGAAVLGILALNAVAPLTLILVAVLGVGAVMLLGGTAVWGRSLNALRH